MFGSEIETAARAHAVAEWPKESVGYVIGGAYVPQVNIAARPGQEFRVADDAWSDDVQAVIHSHTLVGGPWPSEADMRGQLASGVPWALCTADHGAASPLVWWGDHVLDAPLVGRGFVPGVTDCYELVRAWFWQQRRVRLPSVPRDASWWERPGLDLLAGGFAAAGFERVAPEEAREGDGLLMAIPATGGTNHCGVLLGDGTMLHHRADQLSRREPWSGAWRRLTRMVVRHAH